MPVSRLVVASALALVCLHAAAQTPPVGEIQSDAWVHSADPFFSRSNAWLGNPDAQGHCAAALKDNPRAAVVLVPNAPHTLLNLPAARLATAGFLAQWARP